MPTASAPDAPPPVNYVLIDDENVPKLDLSAIEGKTVHVILLLGPKKATLPMEQLLAMTKQVASTQLIWLENGGDNALDFALVYYLGRAVQMHPGASFHIVSRDKDYNSLIKHLKNQDIHIQRHPDATTLTFGPPRNPVEMPVPPAPQNLKSAEDMLSYLRRQTENTPKTHKKLSNYIKAHLGEDMTDAHVENVILKLEKDGHVSFDEQGRATYDLNKVTS
ncbi:MAG: PIN domain-containing protein [Verrucomicrobiaceae bacterium]